MVSKEYLECPNCGSIMVLREGPHGEFYGCSTYSSTRCSGTRQLKEGYGKITMEVVINRGRGQCVRCEHYDDLSSLGLCTTCQEDFDNE